MKRLAALLLALLLVVGLFAGCADNSSPSTAPSTAPSKAPDDGLVYPMVSVEPETFTIWQAFSNAYLGSMNDSEFVTELAKRTNVTIVFEEVATVDAATPFNLLMASDDYPEVVRPPAPGYIGGPDKAVNDGVYLKINDYVEQYMPNYQNLRATVPTLDKQTLTDAGNMWGVSTIANPAEYPWMGMAIRQDILDNAGVASPLTLAEWEVALQTLKAAGVTKPLVPGQNGLFYNSEFVSAFGIAAQFYQKNGKVEFGMIQPEFKEYLTLMNDWYSKGLVDSEFVGNGLALCIFAGGQTFADTMTGLIGASLFPWGYTDNAATYQKYTEIDGFILKPLAAPRVNAGDKIDFRFVSYEVLGTSAVMVTAEPKIEIILKTFDYLFTREGEILMNFGIEDKSFDMVDGVPKYNSNILAHPDGFPPRDAAMFYCWDNGIGLSDFKRLWQHYEGLPNEGALEAYNVWNGDGSGMVIPAGITRTEQEDPEYSQIYTDIQTYWTENIAQFIIGTKPLSDFDSFVAQIKSMNIERCIEIQQNALDRFNARG